MSKILEALANAQADARGGGGRNGGSPPGYADWDDREITSAGLSPVDMEEEMVALHQRLDARLPDRPHRAIEFIASRAGEGTSTVVGQFARVSATRFNQRVLLLTAGLGGYTGRDSGMGSDSIVADAASSTAGVGGLTIVPLPQELVTASHAAEASGPAASWARLLSAFDLILVDAPPATASPLGLAVARQVDGVVLVLAAEATRWPVAERVRQSIERSGGRVLGVVFNKRQYHIPEWIYRRL